jgi:hypothetical protein
MNNICDTKCDTFQKREFRVMAVNQFAMFAYDPVTEIAESTHPSTVVTPAVSEFNEEQVNAAFAHINNVLAQNLHNAGRLQRSFPQYRRHRNSVFLMKLTVDANGDVISNKIFRAYKLKHLFWACAELYFSWENGGIFQPGLYERALAVLSRKRGAFDAVRDRFQMAAHFDSPEVRRDQLIVSTSEKSFVNIISRDIHEIAVRAAETRVLLDLEVPFGAGGGFQYSTTPKMQSSAIRESLGKVTSASSVE